MAKKVAGRGGIGEGWRAIEKNNCDALLFGSAFSSAARQHRAHLPLYRLAAFATILAISAQHGMDGLSRGSGSLASAQRLSDGFTRWTRSCACWLFAHRCAISIKRRAPSATPHRGALSPRRINALYGASAPFVRATLSRARQHAHTASSRVTPCATIASPAACATSPLAFPLGLSRVRAFR